MILTDWLQESSRPGKRGGENVEGSGKERRDIMSSGVLHEDERPESQSGSAQHLQGGSDCFLGPGILLFA